MNIYKAFYNKQVSEVAATTSREAQTKAATQFKAKKIWPVTVVLLSKEGVLVEHTPQSVCP